MIHILLTTLKVICILLSITLGLIVTLLLIVLFVPIRYKGKAHNTDIVAKITWALHLVSIWIEYKEKEFKYVIKILGITINTDKNNKKKTDKKEKPKKKVKQTQEKSNKPKAIEETKKDNKPSDTSKAEVRETVKQIEEKPKSKKKSISQKLSEAINNIKFKIRSICDKIKNIKNNISDYKEFLTTEEAKENIKEILKIVFDLLIYILPTKLRGNVKFGMENPETTGKVLGVICMFYGLYGDKIDLEPDFDNKVFEADVQFKGRIRLYRLLLNAFKLWRNEWLKKLIEFVKTH